MHNLTHSLKHNANDSVTKRGVILETLMIFLISGLAMFFSVHYGIPALIGLGWGFAPAYLLCFYTPLAGLFFCSLILYKKEGHRFSVREFAARMRLFRWTRKTLIWSVAFFAFSVMAYLIALQPIGAYLERTVGFLAAGDFFPPGLHPNKPAVPGEFFGMDLTGQWWFAAAYLIGWFFNIFGEELMFRGYLLPKQEKVFGNRAWLYHGILWGFWHAFWYWNVAPYLLFLTIPMLFLVQKTKNTWSIILVHGLSNLVPLAMIIAGIVSP